tara:strand:+ start:17146 stop:17790 length:645 start_codon:yes stop_codon:yes gene_type:complete
MALPSNRAGVVGGPRDSHVGPSAAVDSIGARGIAVSCEGDLDVQGNLNAIGADTQVGVRYMKKFNYSLANTTAVATAYADDDCLVELGALEVPIGAAAIIFDNVLTNVTVVAGQILVGNIQVSATAGTATNAAITAGTEIVGADAVYLDAAGGNLTVTEINPNLNAVAVRHDRPGIQVAATLINVYLCTSTTINADITAGRGQVYIEYFAVPAV